MPKQINTASVGQRLVRLFSLKGRFQPVLDEVIVPVVSVDADEVERLPASSQMFIAAGGAGVYNFCALHNPTTDKLYRVHDVFRVSGQTAFYWFTDLTRANLSGGTGPANNAWWEDTRLPGNPTGIFYEGGSTNAPTPAGANLIRNFTLDQNRPLETPFIIGPNGWLILLSDAANSVVQVNMRWTEEPLVSPGYSI